MVDKSATRTVSFFRLVVVGSDGQPAQLPSQSWQSLLSRLAGMSLLGRTWLGLNRKLIGEVLVVDDDYALKLMEPRDENSWLEILRGSEAATPVDAKTIGELVETTIVAFLPDKNVFGVIRGSTASPTHLAVAEWLDHLEIDGQRLVQEDKSHLVAEPALSVRQREQLSASDGVVAATMRVSTSQSAALESAGATILGETLKKLKETYGDLLVTVTLRVPRGKDGDAARKQLKVETQRWESSEAAKDAISATLITYDAEAKAHQEDVNFVSQRITMQRGVPLHDATGNPIRNDSAVRAILAAAYDMQVDLDNLD